MKVTAEELADVKAAFQNIWNAVPMQARKRIEEHHARIMEHFVGLHAHATKAHDDETTSHGATKNKK